MKNTNQILLVVWISAIALTGGCFEHSKKTETVKDPNALPKGIKVMTADGSKFPKYLAGTWIQEGEISREFVFTPDGRLESVVIGIGETRMYPLGTVKKPLIDGGQGIFVSGQWDAIYTPKTRELSVLIETTSFRMQVKEQVLEGKMKEYFVGTISKDGLRWDVQYVSLPEYYSTTKEFGRKTLMGGDEEVEETMVFHKVLPAQK
jgi:hypothetical protein